MLVIDGLFFLLELTVGLLVGSLALMADAFHMVLRPSAAGRVVRSLTSEIVERHNLTSNWFMGRQGCAEANL